MAQGCVRAGGSQALGKRSKEGSFCVWFEGGEGAGLTVDFSVFPAWGCGGESSVVDRFGRGGAQEDEVEGGVV